MPRAKPKSDVGKAMARVNDAHFGLAADAPVIPGIESMQDWQTHLDALLADLAPVGALETELAWRIATLLWRLRRPARYEREYIAASIERVPDDFIKVPLRRSMPRTVKDADERVETVERGLELLQVLGDTRQLTEVRDDEIEAIFDALSDDPEVSELLEESVPGFEEGIANVDDWTAPLLRIAFRDLARRAEIEPNDLLRRAITLLAECREERVEERAAMLAEQDRMRRERSLPEASTLHALTRYESNLHRQLVQLMHELEAAQARRRGQSTPLLRADIHMVAEK